MTRYLSRSGVAASAPCRVDMGGTLDLSTFYMVLGDAGPSTVNVALDMRTRVRVTAGTPGKVCVASAGFSPAEFPSGEAPYDHPLGLMFAVADFFQAHGVAIDIHSTSPPRSALGGSSVAAVALVGALDAMDAEIADRDRMAAEEVARLAHRIESGVAGVPCGMQDQLAAACGGVHQWQWQDSGSGIPFRARPLATPDQARALNSQILVAYGGIPHASKDINGRWVKEFLSGRQRDMWRTIAELTRSFADALAAGDMDTVVAAMNEETRLRVAMTPDVLDPMGRRLVADARAAGCGSRFTGAGGGGCLWAIGAPEAIDQARIRWTAAVADHPEARILTTGVDWQGLDVQWAANE